MLPYLHFNPSEMNKMCQRIEKIIFKNMIRLLLQYDRARNI